MGVDWWLAKSPVILATNRNENENTNENEHKNENENENDARIDNKNTRAS